MRRQSDQLKQINSLFSPPSRRDSEIKLFEIKRDLKCDAHGGRRRSSTDSNYQQNVNGISNQKLLQPSSMYSSPSLSGNGYNSSDFVVRRSSITSSATSKDDKLRRRQSFTEGYADRNRKRHSLNSAQMKSIEHPSAFPSLLRSTVSPSTTNINSKSNTNNNNYYDQVDSPRKNTLTRRSSMGSLISNRAKSNNYSSHINNNNNNNINNNLNKRQSFGSNLYLRADSAGQTNLVRRDSFGSSNLSNILNGYPRGSSVPRDYVKPNTNNNNNNKSSTTVPINNNKPTTKKSTQPFGISGPIITNGKASILRKKTSDSVKNDKNKLTKENVTRHVTILENENHNGGNHHHHHNYYEDSDEYTRPRKYSNTSSMEDYPSRSSRRISLDSLDLRRSSMELNEKELSQLNLNSLSSSSLSRRKSGGANQKFIPITTLEDESAIRSAEFHPGGALYSVGSNSRIFRICEYPSLTDIIKENAVYSPKILYERKKYHKGSIYCMSWSPDGELVATGSNDKTVKLARYDGNKKELVKSEIELTMHDGTVRDICFLEDRSNKASLMISAGAGDCKIYVSDCATGTPFQSLSGHSGHVSSLYHWGGAMFVSGSRDKTVRFWDLRSWSCVNTIQPVAATSRHGSPIASVAVDPSGRLLVSGHEDSSCVMYDIRGERPIQCFRPHTSDIRSVRFSPSAYYLLTAGYDGKLCLCDLQGDLTQTLPTVVAAQHNDKVISGRWHPTDFSFLSTSADKTVTLWSMPPP